MNNKQIVKCPSCNSGSRFIDKVVQTKSFGGRAIEIGLDEIALYICSKCCLGFKWPQIDQRHAENLYVESSENNWSAWQADRHDWNIAKNWISTLVPIGSSVIDLGCYDGAFHSSMINDYICHGVEIQPNGIAKAESRGISIVSESLNDIPSGYDLITAFDVIEHISNPKKFLDECIKSLNPNGRLIISSGNFDAFSFRMMRGSYWYCIMPEHVSFIGIKWFNKSIDSNAKITEIAKFSHNQSSVIQWTKEAVGNLLWLASPNIILLLRAIGLGSAKQIDSPVCWASSKDHIIIMIERNG